MTLRLLEHRGHGYIEDRWDLVHRHALGRAGEAFVAGLERGELIAARCPDCGRTLLPPRSFCERCFRATEFEPFAAREGELLSFTINRRAFTDSPPVPFAIGYARLDGADTALGALLSGVDLGAAAPDAGLRIGARVALEILDRGAGIDRVRLRVGPGI